MSKILTDKFWQNFAKQSWEKKPLLAKNLSSPVSAIGENHIFATLIEYSNHCRKIKSSSGFKLYVRGERQHEEDVLQFLPQKKDKNFLGYHQRMNSYFADYCLVCDELLQASLHIWQPLQEFTSHLFSYVGFPNRFFEIGLYIGNYRQTPFGVHVDGCGVFSFPVVGHKTFRLWEPSYVKNNPGLNSTHSYEKYKKRSRTLTASVGDMTYWPSAAWHIAESDGSFSATWSLGVWVDKTHQELIEESLGPLLKLKLGSSATEPLTKPLDLECKDNIVKLPKNFKDSLTTLKKISSDELHDQLLKLWLGLFSQQGFKVRPAADPQPCLKLQDQIELRKSQKIFSAKLKTIPKILYGVQGVVVESAPSKSLTKLIDDLNSGKTCALAKYLTGATTKQHLNILRKLAASNAIVRKS